jgi:hypothetical protein
MCKVSDRTKAGGSCPLRFRSNKLSGASMAELTQEELKRQVLYDEETGVFTNKITRNPRALKGAIIGNDNGKGYLFMQLNKNKYYLHRLAYLYMTGEMPINEIDHINGVRHDNRWINIRHVTVSENMRNVAIGSKNTSGHVGVTWHKYMRKWMAQIKMNKKNICLGYFSEKENAVKARMKANIKYGFHKNHGRKA